MAPVRLGITVFFALSGLFAFAFYDYLLVTQATSLWLTAWLAAAACLVSASLVFWGPKPAVVGWKRQQRYWRNATLSASLALGLLTGTHLLLRLSLDRELTPAKRIGLNTSCEPVLAHYVVGTGAKPDSWELKRVLDLPFQVCRASALSRLLAESPKTLCPDYAEGQRLRCASEVGELAERTLPFDTTARAIWLYGVTSSVQKEAALGYVSSAGSLLSLAHLVLQQLEQLEPSLAGSGSWLGQFRQATDERTFRELLRQANIILDVAGKFIEAKGGVLKAARDQRFPAGSTANAQSEVEVELKIYEDLRTRSVKIEAWMRLHTR